MSQLAVFVLVFLGLCGLVAFMTWILADDERTDVAWVGCATVIIIGVLAGAAWVISGVLVGKG